MNGQVDLTDVRANPPTQISECRLITIDNVLTVTSSMNCNSPISLIRDDGDMISGLGTIEETFTSFPSTVTFSEPGLFSFLCENKSIADQCFNVIPVPTPTIGEWGLIILSLLMAILAIVSIKQPVIKQNF